MVVNSAWHQLINISTFFQLAGFRAFCHGMSSIAQQPVRHLDDFLAHKSLSKPRTLLKLAKQERLRKMLETSRAMRPKYILLHTKNKL